MATEQSLLYGRMDRPDLGTARGVPFTWTGVGVPTNDTVFSVPVAATEHRPER
ncbi:hypothetical protein [Streptomyces sp. NPDC060194]|uniref:hypothetical protein n=1 Tax=Streptomyces sp. NPDC060194 TaxID=3347069 RepID=UPI003666E0C5